MNISIGVFKVNSVTAASAVNIGTNFIINPSSNTKNQIGTLNNGDRNTLISHNPIYDPDITDYPAANSGYY
jgi:hypothetical protein